MYRPLALRHALAPGEIAVRAYLSEAACHKRARDRGRLSGAVLEQEPAAGLEVIGGGADDITQGGKTPFPSYERELRLAHQRRQPQRRVFRRHIRRVTHEQMKGAIQAG